MLQIGYHASFAAGYLAMGQEAASIGADTFQFFSRNPRGGKARNFDPSDAEALREFLIANHFAPILAHAPYTMNACAAEEKLRAFARDLLRDDLTRLETLPGNLYNLHPGCHVGQGVEAGIAMIADALNAVLTPTQSTIVLLEGMSGKGSEIGAGFAELRAIIDRVKCADKMGVCLDTCHLYSAGYDIVNHLDEVLTEFDDTVGLSRLHAIHLNDSMTPFNSHKDRHETIGNGSIGLAALVKIITHEKLKHLPFYLETPNELAGYAAEIKLLRAQAE